MIDEKSSFKRFVKCDGRQVQCSRRFGQCDCLLASAGRVGCLMGIGWPVWASGCLLGLTGWRWLAAGWRWLAGGWLGRLAGGCWLLVLGASAQNFDSSSCFCLRSSALVGCDMFCDQSNVISVSRNATDGKSDIQRVSKIVTGGKPSVLSVW